MVSVVWKTRVQRRPCELDVQRTSSLLFVQNRKMSYPVREHVLFLPPLDNPSQTISTDLLPFVRIDFNTNLRTRSSSHYSSLHVLDTNAFRAKFTRNNSSVFRRRASVLVLKNVRGLLSFRVLLA